jgi:two-component system sensor histidine kinase KdpD
MRIRHEVAWTAAGLATIALLTVAYTRGAKVSVTTVALSFLLVVMVVAAFATRRVAVVLSVLAFACFNFFFLPPTGTFTIAQPEDLVALCALLAVSLVASHLATQARRRAQEAIVLGEERTRAQLAMKSAELKSAILASLSHDLKTPITAVTIAANNLRASWLSEELRRDQVELVIDELARLRRLFENMIEMARIETQAVTPEHEWVDGAALVEAATAKADRALVSHRVEVSDRTEGLVVRIDPRLTSAALAHVLENAAQHSPSGTAIAVGIAIDAGHLQIDIRDHGPGVASATLTHLVHAGPEPSGQPGRFGRGLGLAISQGLLEAEGGRLSAANDPGGGAVFTIRIPVAVRVAATEQDSV